MPTFSKSLLTTAGINERSLFDFALVVRLVRAIEGRIEPLETQREELDQALASIQEMGLDRINEVLVPAIESVLRIQERGFLIANSGTSVTLAQGNILALYVDDEDQRDLFTPSPFTALTREDNPDDYAITRTIAYDRENGEYRCEVISVAGDPGPHDDWVIAALAGPTVAMVSAMDTLANTLAEVAQLKGDAETASGAAGSAKDTAETAAGLSMSAAEAAEQFMESAQNAAAEAAADVEYNLQVYVSAATEAATDAEGHAAEALQSAQNAATFEPENFAAAVHDHAIADVTSLQSSLDGKQSTSEKGEANGYAGLDGDGKVPEAQLPDSIGGSHDRVRLFLLGLSSDDGPLLESYLQDQSNLSGLYVIVANRADMQEIAGLAGPMAAVIASETAMAAVIASETAMSAIDVVDRAVVQIMTIPAGLDWTEYPAPSDVAASETAMAAVAASETAMAAVIASETAMAAVIASETAMSAIDVVDRAVVQIMTIPAGLDWTEYPAPSDVAASETAMAAVAASETAMAAVIASETAMAAVAASETAMDAVAASETAMAAVIASETAMAAVAASETAQIAISESVTALDALRAVASTDSSASTDNDSWESVGAASNGTVFVTDVWWEGSAQPGTTELRYLSPQGVVFDAGSGWSEETPVGRAFNNLEVRRADSGNTFNRTRYVRYVPINT